MANNLKARASDVTAIDTQAQFNAAYNTHSQKKMAKGSALPPLVLFAACLLPQPSVLDPPAGAVGRQGVSGGGGSGGGGGGDGDAAALLLGLAKSPSSSQGRGGASDSTVRGLPSDATGPFVLDIYLGMLDVGRNGAQKASSEHVKVRTDENGDAITKDITIDDVNKAIKPVLKTAGFKRAGTSLVAVGGKGSDLTLVFSDPDLNWAR